MITRGTIIIDTQGAVVGQVNGLAVMEFGDVSFGRPTRITARTYLGQRGVVSIDRESQLSGKIHDKGVLILSGYLGWQYGQQSPLSVSAMISFEQGYDTIDGDSASLAETCAILSSLADVPIRQDLAITGSINQKGEVQPIGGVNVKVEGHHDLCRATGFTGSQGVILPARNVQNLMLREDVVHSVAEGKFHIYQVDSVDEALELLTGLSAGERAKDGTYPEGSMHNLIDKKLSQMAETMRHAGDRHETPPIVPTKPVTPPPPRPPSLPS
jgi:ATP-dependent Lon protease